VIESTLRAMDGPGRPGSCRPLFEISQRDDADGGVRASLIGELDLSVTGGLGVRLGQLQLSKRRVRLDLSKLEFIDCSGIGTILRALAQARRSGWELEVDPAVNPDVARTISLAGVSSTLWPAVSG
jgi:anti-sigma B factor antagonist